MSTNSSKQILEELPSDLKKAEQQRFAVMVAEYFRLPLPKACTIGFQNMGNNCYMNCMVQILINHPVLYYYFQNISEKTY